MYLPLYSIYPFDCVNFSLMKNKQVCEMGWADTGTLFQKALYVAFYQRNDDLPNRRKYVKKMPKKTN